MADSYRRDPLYEAALRRHVDTGSAWIHVEKAAVEAERRRVLKLLWAEDIEESVGPGGWTDEYERGWEAAMRIAAALLDGPLDA